MFGKPVAWPMALDGADRQGRPTACVRPWTSRVSRRARGAGPGAGRRASPRRSRRRATARSRRCSPSPATRCISAPDSARLDAALPELDCMISVDNYLNETTRFAHVILPGPSPLEQPHFDELIWGWAARSGAQLERSASSRRADRPDEVGDPRPPRRAAAPAGRTTTSTSRRSTTAASPRSADRRGSTPPTIAPAVRRRRPGADPRPADPHRPVGRPLRRGARRAHARADQGAAARHRPGARWCPRVDEMVVHARRARSTSRPSTSSATCRARATRIAETADDGFRARRAAATSARTTRGCTT